jgi:hypothetical protein
MERYYSRFRTLKKLKRLRRILYSRLHMANNQDTGRSIFIAGAGRSGTTWLAEMIDTQIPCRLMFEPFFFEKVLPGNKYHLFHYMRPEHEDPVLFDFARTVFSGQIRDQRIDWHNRRLYSQYRIVKDVRANLFMKWLHDRFPEVPFFFLIRHPCAVALSRRELGWATDLDIEPFLKQENLVSDFLRDKLELISSAKTDTEKHALIWSISNLVPLCQFELADLPVIYYENLCTKPEHEMSRVLGALGNKQFNVRHLNVQKPSVTTTVTSAVVTGEDKISRWKDHLTTFEIDRILYIVEEFGLGHLYGDSLTPNGSRPIDEVASREVMA